MNMRFAFICAAICFTATMSFAQRASGPPNRAKLWFVARVVDTDPFTVEYVDRSSYHSDPTYKMDRYQNAVSVSPQAQYEDVKKFKLGDMISGEHCNYALMNCPPEVIPLREGRWDRDHSTAGLRIPPDFAINLKKIPNKYKTKYARTGMLLYYKPHEDNIVRSMSIFRDGTLFINTHYAGGIRRKLSASELRRIEKAFFDSGSDQLSTSTSSDYFKYSLTTIFGKNRNVQIDYSSRTAKPFVQVLDGLIAMQLRKADYRITYRWRFEIKDWQYGDTLPLDQAADSGYDYIRRNRDRLSKLLVPKQFYEENKNANGSTVSRFVYRFKGKLYHFSFASCTDRPTGSWGCYFAHRLGKIDTKGIVIGDHDEWPSDLKTKLHDIPSDALLTSDHYLGKAMPIEQEDVAKHREFYKGLLGATAEFREGNFIYAHVRVWMR